MLIREQMAAGSLINVNTSNIAIIMIILRSPRPQQTSLDLLLLSAADNPPTLVRTTSSKLTLESF